MTIRKSQVAGFFVLLMAFGTAFAHGENTLENYDGQIVVKVLFPIGSAATDVDAFVEKMRSTVPKYQSLDGLISKFYVLSGDNKKAGGLYLWQSVEKANAWHTPEWYDYIKDAYGEAPSVEYLKAPIIVRN